MAKSTPLRTFFSHMLTDMKTRNKKNGFKNDDRVTPEFLVHLWHEQRGMDCWTGRPMTTTRGLVDKKVRPTLCTPDRRENTRGYDMDNIRLSQWIVNKMRGDMSESDFGDICADIKL